MAIDWFTVGAQIINFLILIWLLKKFLYRPVLNAMNSREQGLVDRQQQLERQIHEAEQLKMHYEAGLQQLNFDKEKILSEAGQQAEADKVSRLQSLNDEMQQKKDRFAEEMLKQQQESAALITRTIAEKALQLSAKVLSSLADQSLEQQIVEHFLTGLDALTEHEQILLQQSLTQDKAATVLTRFPLNDALCLKIRNRLSQSESSSVVFEQDPQLLCGISLETGGRRWEWNIDRYLAELESELLKPLDQQRQ